MDLPEEYRTLTITGEISVETATSIDPSSSYCYLLMGEVYSGKSSFVDPFAGFFQSLDIVGKSTEQVTAYRVLNVYKGRFPVYLFDTPGLDYTSDIISHVETINGIKAGLGKYGLKHVNHVLWFFRISDRMLLSGTRIVIDAMKELLKPPQGLRSTP